MSIKIFAVFYQKFTLFHLLCEISSICEHDAMRVCMCCFWAINKFTFNFLSKKDMGFEFCLNLPCQAPSNIGLPSRRDHTISGRGCPVAAQRNRKKLSSLTTIGLFGTPDNQQKLKAVNNLYMLRITNTRHHKMWIKFH